MRLPAPLQSFIAVFRIFRQQVFRIVMLPGTTAGAAGCNYIIGVAFFKNIKISSGQIACRFHVTVGKNGYAAALLFCRDNHLDTVRRKHPDDIEADTGIDVVYGTAGKISHLNSTGMPFRLDDCRNLRTKTLMSKTGENPLCAESNGKPGREIFSAGVFFRPSH